MKEIIVKKPDTLGFGILFGNTPVMLFDFVCDDTLVRISTYYNENLLRNITQKADQFNEQPQFTFAETYGAVQNIVEVFMPDMQVDRDDKKDFLILENDKVLVLLDGTAAQMLKFVADMENEDVKFLIGENSSGKYAVCTIKRNSSDKGHVDVYFRTFWGDDVKGSLLSIWDKVNGGWLLTGIPCTHFEVSCDDNEKPIETPTVKVQVISQNANVKKTEEKVPCKSGEGLIKKTFTYEPGPLSLMLELFVRSNVEHFTRKPL